MKFSSYALNQNLVEALNKLGYIDLTPIQEQTIVKALKGKSFIAKSETGSGKTHSYLIPTISNLKESINKTQVIIVEPTLELCNQSYRFAEQICKITDNFRVNNISLSNYKKNEKIICDKPTIIITTVGKLKDVIFINKNLDISSLQTIVLDEADMLLEGEDSQDIISLMDYIQPKQKLIFTATMKEHQITSLKKLFQVNDMIDVSKNNFTSKNVSHHFVDIKHRPLSEAIMIFLKTVNPYFVMIFASKKNEINKLYNQLCENEVKCTILTSDVSLRERKSILKRITNGEFNVVLCSDLASRGLDLEKVSHIISLDIPSNIDYYYHRSGRTGRYKDKGDSYIFYDDELNSKAKGVLEKKLSFDYLILRQEGLKIDKRHIKQPKKKNEKLEDEIKKELAKVKTNKVKPNYKKKMKKAVKKAIRNHKRKIIMENLKSKRKMMAYTDD